MVGFARRVDYFDEQSSALASYVSSITNLSKSTGQGGVADIISTANENIQELQLIDKEPRIRLLGCIYLSAGINSGAAGRWRIVAFLV